MDGVKCIKCGLDIVGDLHVYTTFPVCKHPIHEECRDTERFVHHRSGCPGCAKDTRPILDMGDDCLFHRSSKQIVFQRRNREIIDAGPYRPSEIRVHCQEMFRKRAAQKDIQMGVAAPPGQSGAQAGWTGSWWSYLRGGADGTPADGKASAPKVEAMPASAYNPHEAQWRQAQEFALTHQDIDRFRENDITVVTLYDAGVELHRMRAAGYTLSELHKLHFTWEHMLVMGLHWKHLEDMYNYPTRQLRDLFGVTYKTIIDLAAVKGDTALGVERFCSLNFTDEDLRNLGLESIQDLVDLGLERKGFLNLCGMLNIDELFGFKLKADHLRKYKLLARDIWTKLRWTNHEAVASRLDIPIAQIPASYKTEAPRPLKTNTPAPASNAPAAATGAPSAQPLVRPTGGGRRPSGRSTWVGKHTTNGTADIEEEARRKIQSKHMSLVGGGAGASAYQQPTRGRERTRYGGF